MTEAIYVFYSNNEFLLNHTVEEKVAELKVDPFNIVRYDMLESSSDDVLEDLKTVSFFAEKKVIIVRKLSEIAKESESIIKAWVSYLENPNPDVILIVISSELMSDKNPIGEALFRNAFIEKIREMDKKE